MVKITDFPNFPKYKLFSYLIKRADESTEKRIELLTQLENFREKISDESTFIWDTFPEYMPHDEKHHLNPLFYLSDLIIGDGYKKFNFSELYLLAAGIYGHDWGMAISKKSKKFILNLSLPATDFEDNPTRLLEERNLFLKFVKTEGLMVQVDKNYDKLSDGYWRKFVRHTHAERSRYRVKDHFEKNNDSGIGETVGKICLGHSLDFRYLEREDFYPKSYTIFGETVNLKAITLYLRIVDLMDIGKSRASLNIYNFISPTDEESIIHWEKNLSIQPISVSKFPTRGRQIHVRGIAKNPEIFAELEDHKNYCTSQLETTEKIFAYMNDKRHNFDIVYLDWNIEPDGFKAISIKFEFERDEIFKILSSEIYQRDPFVFLRELLQNSIDAIRLKKEFYKRIKESPVFSGFIKVDITHNVDGKIAIKWFDNGIGMDEYIVHHYLSVIGKSYYKKSNLKNLGINLEPISKFGIGILSCFYIADSVEIQTFKDPLIDPDSIPLEIKIPNFKKQFYVKEISRDSATQGTQILIFTDNEKFLRHKGNQKFVGGEFTNYLKKIAGFVDFPIIVTESGKKTIILHPEKKTELISKKNPDAQVEKIDYHYPISSLLFNQDVELAKSLFKIKVINLKSQLHLRNFEGAISFLLLPMDYEWTYLPHYLSYHDETGIEIIDKKAPSRQLIIRWHEGENEIQLIRLFGQITGYTDKLQSYSIFLDGILLQNEKNPLSRFSENRFVRLPPPILQINLLNKSVNEINLARTNLLEKNNHWFSVIEDALTKYFINTEIIPILNKNKKERWYTIGRMILSYPIKIDSLKSIIPERNIPIISLEKYGKIKFTNIGDIVADNIYAVPEEITKEFLKRIISDIVEHREYNGFLNSWNGISCYGIGSNLFLHGNYPSINQAYAFSDILLQKSYICSEITFLYPPTPRHPPIIQKIFRKTNNKTKKISIKTILEKACRKPELLTSFEIDQFNKTIWEFQIKIPHIYKFSGSFNDYFAHGWNAINHNHPLGLKIIQILSKYNLTPNVEYDKIFGKLSDQSRKFQDFDCYTHEPERKAMEILKNLLMLFMELKEISEEEYENFSSMTNLFIPQSLLILAFEQSYIPNNGINPLFGEQI